MISDVIYYSENEKQCQAFFAAFLQFHPACFCKRLFYDQIDQTAYYTDYNTKKILLGDTYWKTISKWVKAPEVVLDENSIMNIIPDIYDKLDGIEGPFDIFTAYGSYSTTIAPLLGTNSSVNVGIEFGI